MDGGEEASVHVDVHMEYLPYRIFSTRGITSQRIEWKVLVREKHFLFSQSDANQSTHPSTHPSYLSLHYLLNAFFFDAHTSP